MFGVKCARCRAVCSVQGVGRGAGRGTGCECRMVHGPTARPALWPYALKGSLHPGNKDLSVRPSLYRYALSCGAASVRFIGRGGAWHPGHVTAGLPFSVMERLA